MFFSSACLCLWLCCGETGRARASQSQRCAREPELNVRLGDLCCQFTRFFFPVPLSLSRSLNLPPPFPPEFLCRFRTFLSVLPSSVILSLSSHLVHPVFSRLRVSALTAPGKSFALSVLMPQINYSYVFSVLLFCAISGVSWLWGKTW